MPRAFTAAETSRLAEALLRAGAARFAAGGLDGVSVAELAAAVGIGKGSFYLFYPSKEALLFACHEREEEAVRLRVLAPLGPFEAAGDGVGLLEAFLATQAAALRDHPLLRRLADPATLRALIRVVPPDVVAEHRARDRAWRAWLQRSWQEAGLLAPDAPPDLLHHLSAGVFALMLAQDVLDDGATLVLDTWAAGAALRWGRS